MEARSICITGAAPDTGNLGVSALCRSLVTGLARRVPGAALTVLDHGRGVRPGTLGVNGSAVTARRIGAVNSRRFYRAESYPRLRLAARLGGLGSPAARALISADAVLAMNGGDSFTDLYGPGRLDTVAVPMEVALRAGVPLILPPQTYGPFRGAAARERAARIVRGAAMAWARDARSFDVLRELLGDAFDPQRHRQGVDVAFGLEAAEPPAELVPDRLRAWWDEPDTPVVGLNVSGLIYNDPGAARTRYGFIADYRAVIHGLIERLAADGARVVLVPHVIARPGAVESDPDACRAAAAALPESVQDRVLALSPIEDPSWIKWVIARFDWFCGTRMHATIAALSSGVPTAAIAYSPKTLGVFETCGQGGCVADPRRLDEEAVLATLRLVWQGRCSTKERLVIEADIVRGEASQQMDALAARTLQRFEKSRDSRQRATLPASSVQRP